MSGLAGVSELFLKGRGRGPGKGAGAERGGHVSWKGGSPPEGRRGVSVGRRSHAAGYAAGPTRFFLL
jgi:hypothetical protein